LREQGVAFFEKKAPRKNFVTFTRDLAMSPGSRKVFAELFSKSDRLLPFWKQSATMIDWPRRGAAAMTGLVKAC
jgi:hypothetical protein